MSFLSSAGNNLLLVSFVFANQVLPGPMNSLFGGVGCDVEDPADFLQRKVFPQRQPQNLDVPGPQPLRCVEHLSDFLPDYHLILNQRRRLNAYRLQLLIEFLTTIGPAPMVGHREICDSIQPTKGILTIGGVVDLAPHRQEDVGGEIVD